MTGLAILPFLRYPAKKFPERLMIQKLIFLAFIGGIVYLNYTNPKLADHQALLAEELQSAGHISAEMRERIFQNIDFSNFLVCSVTKTVDDSKMISLGYMKKVKLVNQGWVQDVRKQHRLGSGY